MKIFWSWQSDTQESTGRYFVRDALIEAIAYLKVPEDIEDRQRQLTARRAVWFDPGEALAEAGGNVPAAVVSHPGLSHEHDGSFRLHVVLLTARYFLRVLKRIDRASEENVSVRIRNQITRLL